MDVSISFGKNIERSSETIPHKPYNLVLKTMFNQGCQNTTKEFSVTVRYNKIVSLK